MVTDILDGLGAPGTPGADGPRRTTGLGGGGATDPAAKCHVCGLLPRRHCAACSRPACTDHLWTMLGVCTVCARADRMDRFHREAEVEGRNWLD